MKWQIIWSEFSEKQLDQIFDYHQSKVSQKVAYNIVMKILEDSEKLKTKPFSGQIEEHLTYRKYSYWYIISGNYEIIYSVDEKFNQIRISDVFDTRQNPLKIIRDKP